MGWLCFCLPCLPRTFIALKLNSSILKTHLRRPVTLYSLWIFFSLRAPSQLLVFDESKFSLDFHLPSIANLLSLALLLCVHKARWWLLWIPFNSSVLCIILQRELLSWYYAATVNVTIDWNLLLQKGKKKANHLVNNWELNFFMFFFSDIAFIVISLKFLLNGFPFCYCWVDHSIFL